MVEICKKRKRRYSTHCHPQKFQKIELGIWLSLVYTKAYTKIKHKKSVVSHRCPINKSMSLLRHPQRKGQ